jgi:hypothetical protein
VLATVVSVATVFFQQILLSNDVKLLHEKMEVAQGKMQLSQEKMQLSQEKMQLSQEKMQLQLMSELASVKRDLQKIVPSDTPSSTTPQ